MRLLLWIPIFCTLGLAHGAELTGGFYGKEGEEPKTWQEDLSYMIGASRAEPALRGTFQHLTQLARKGNKRKVTREYWYSLFSIPGGILGFRLSEDPTEPGVHPNILLGVHPSAKEPPSLPFRVPGKVGGIPLLSRKSVVLPHPPVATEEESYFGEKCTAYVYGAGHWITRYFVRDDRILAIAFALEP
jgi:hypothetical protein